MCGAPLAPIGVTLQTRTSPWYAVNAKVHTNVCVSLLRTLCHMNIYDQFSYFIFKFPPSKHKKPTALQKSVIKNKYIVPGRKKQRGGTLTATFLLKSHWIHHDVWIREQGTHMRADNLLHVASTPLDSGLLQMDFNFFN